MNTLHLCHWKNTTHLKLKSAVIHKDDSLVIIGDMNSDEISFINQLLSPLAVNWYLVNDQNQPHINCKLINHDEWLTLILNHKNCFAWK